MLKTNSQIELADAFLRSTGVNIFLTGKAGTGKTTFLKNIVSSVHKRVVVAAPTGVAAINARGVTLHSLFQLSFGAHLPGSSPNDNKQFSQRKMSKRKLSLLRSIELLVIDEISMVRCDLLDAVDETLRKVRRNSMPFGGVQLLMIGDIQQLSPICSEEEWQLLSSYYTSPYFFDSHALKSSNYITIELKEIFRQSDEKFMYLLNAVRENNLTSEVLNALHTRYMPDFEPSDGDGYITLTTHNKRANDINTNSLARIKAPAVTYKASTTGEYPEWAYPNDTKLELKKGAQVIFIKNDLSTEKQYYNGMIGKVLELDGNSVMVQAQNDDKIITLSAVTWENIEYTLDPSSGEITENIKGTFTQIPLKCAWAITIHKSQGLTFDKAIIDAGNSFAHGQVYVALSRCRTFEGMILKSQIANTSLVRDTTIEGFSNSVLQNAPGEQELETHKRNYFYNILAEIFDFNNLNRLSYTLSKLLNNNLIKEYTKLTEELYSLTQSTNPELQKVGDTFKKQLYKAVFTSSNYQSDSYIKERLEKASEYFSDKVSHLESPILQALNLTPDSKEVVKRLKALKIEIIEELNIKKCSLELCKTGFTIEAYLKQKFSIITQQDIPKELLTPKTKTILKPSDDIINQGLYDALRAWRNEKAKEADVSAYHILTNRSAIEIQATLPDTIAKLKKINGIGKIKLDNYGDEIIELVKNYALYSEINIDTYHAEEIGFITETKEVKKQAKEDDEPKIDSHLITLEMYKSGKILEEIAVSRGLTYGTIFIHATKNVVAGDMDINDFIDNKTIDIIINTIQDNPTLKMKEIKELLGEDISYNEIRMVCEKYNLIKRDN